MKSVKLANINPYTIPQMPTEALEAALRRTANRKLAAAIRHELDSRQAAGVNRPLRMEDFLG